jgi:uncharacterized protein (DUF885 family)
VALAVVVGLVLLCDVGLTQGQDADAFFARFTDEWMRLHTDAAASSKYFSGREQEAVERRLEAVNSTAFLAAEQALVAKGLRELAALDRATMSESQSLSADLIRWDLEERRDRARFEDLRFPFGEYRGPHVALAETLTVGHAINSERDAENYVARLQLVATRMDEGLARARMLAANGLLPPRFILSLTLDQMRAFVATTPSQNPFVKSFAESMGRATSIRATRREALRAEAEKETAERIYPAWKRAIAALEPMVSMAGDDVGLWRFKEGPAAYQHALRRYTTTSLTPDQVHQIGLDMVTALERRIDEVLRRSGRTEGSVTSRQAAFWAAQPRYEAGEAGVKARQAFIDATIADAQRRASVLFDTVPRSAVVAQPYPSFMGVRSASYRWPAPDGSRPGVFQYTATPQGGPGGRKSTIYHETIPGHHYQLALVLEDARLPRFRRAGVFGSNSANSEGWGLYAEKLAAENGWYEGDLAGELDQLEQEIFRARRLVVDTGMHAKRWTRQQAIDYGVAPNEIDRYVMMPGQACSYMIGQIKLVELRERARQALGGRFSIKAYHNLVLGLGIVPLEILEREVERWIARQS